MNCNIVQNNVEAMKVGEKRLHKDVASPLGRKRYLSDIAQTSIFLASQQNVSICTQTIQVDGGNVLR